MINPWQFLFIIILSIFFFFDINVILANLKKNLKQIKQKLKEKEQDRGDVNPNLWFWKPIFYQLNYYPFKKIVIVFFLIFLILFEFTKFRKMGIPLVIFN